MQNIRTLGPWEKNKHWEENKMPLLVDTMFHLQRLTAARHFTWTKSKEGSGQVRTSQEISETDEC